MKKQFLTLGLFLLAAFAGINESNGQAVTWSKPTALNCTNDALHPVAGKEYTYEAEVTSDQTAVDGKEGHWRFWATTNSSFIVNDVFNYGTAITVDTDKLLSASSDYNIPVGDANANTNGSVKLSWTTGMLNSIINGSDSLFVVAYYENAAGCTDQANVWMLQPKNFFTVDIIAMDQRDFVGSKDGYTADAPEVCVDNIESMTFKNGSLSYDYGDNYVYFEFIAANFTGYWIPEFSLGGLNSVQSATYEFTYAKPDTWATTAPTWQELKSGESQISPAGTYTDAGVSIFVRVKIDHNTYENLKGQTLTMYLDGKLADGTYDAVNETCSDPKAADQNDSAQTIITPRPENDDPNMKAPNFFAKTVAN